LVVTFGAGGIVKRDFSTRKTLTWNYNGHAGSALGNAESWRGIDDAFLRRYFV
jgi:hypothetical protein